MNHRHGKLLVVLLTLAFFAPLVLRGEVIFPHPNDIEAGRFESVPEGVGEDGGRLRGFSDQSSLFVPQVAEHLRGPRSSWITTWNPYPEMGRPAKQFKGLGRAYLLTHPFFWLSDDPFLVYTWVTVLAVFLTALFGYLLLEALGLHPAACVAGALGLGLGVQICRKLCFVLFVWGPCWTLALLLGVTLFLRRPTWPRGLFLAFSAYSMFLTAYPQEVIWAAYIVGGYAGLRLWRDRAGWRRGGLLLAGLGACALLGLLCAAPVYLDLALNAVRSARLEVGEDFFLYGMPSMGGWAWALTFFTRLFDCFWFGNPNLPEYPFGFRSWCLTPVYATLLFVAFLHTRRRRLVPLVLFLGVCILLTFWHLAYAFAVEHLGLHLSRHPPMRQAYLPLMLLAAYGCDHVLRAGPEGRVRRVLLACVPGAIALLGMLVAEPAVRTGMVAIGAAIYAGTLLFVWSGSRIVLLVLVAATIFQYGFRLQLTQPLDGIARTSPLVELLREETRDGSRYAWVGSRQAPILTPNQETLFGLRSIHTYNPISARLYQQWVERLSGRPAGHYGARFKVISGTRQLVNGHEQELAGIGLLISRKKLRGKLGTLILSAGEGGVYRTPYEPQLEAQLTAFELAEGVEARGVEIGDSLTTLERLPLERTLDEGDRLVFDVSPAASETVLFVSQQFHPQWRATADGVPAECVLVNGFYQGVLVPSGSERVELCFRPFVRWSWVPQVLFLVAGGAALGLRIRRGRRSVDASGV